MYSQDSNIFLFNLTRFKFLSCQNSRGRVASDFFYLKKQPNFKLGYSKFENKKKDTTLDCFNEN